MYLVQARVPFRFVGQSDCANRHFLGQNQQEKKHETNQGGVFFKLRFTLPLVKLTFKMDQM